MGAFGEKLRQQREQRGLALDAISNTTKISTRMLRALEDEHFDQLPGGVFNKGFVRAYARQVGLNEEEAVADYLAALRESQIQQQSILPDFRAPAGKQKTVGAPVVPSNGRPPIDTPQQEDRRKTNEDRRNQDRRNEARRIEAHRIEAHRHRPTDPPTSPDSATDLSANFLPEPFADTQAAETPGQPAHEPSAPILWGKLAAALLLVAAILAIWNFRRHSQPRAASLPAASRPQQSSAPAPAPVSTPAATSQTASANPLTVGKSSLPGPLASGTLSPGTISSGASSTKPEPTLPGVPPALNQATPAAATANPPLAKKVPAPSPQPPATFTVLIRAEKTTWVSIVADGKPVAEENLIAPAQTSVRASHEIYVRAGNAAGVSFQLNGKEFPAQGNEGEVKTYIFDSTSMHVDPQPQTPTTNR